MVFWLRDRNPKNKKKLDKNKFYKRPHYFGLKSGLPAELEEERKRKIKFETDSDEDEPRDVSLSNCMNAELTRKKYKASVIPTLFPSSELFSENAKL